jgi:hypothetical protein
MCHALIAEPRHPRSAALKRTTPDPASRPGATRRLCAGDLDFRRRPGSPRPGVARRVRPCSACPPRSDEWGQNAGEVAAPSLSLTSVTTRAACTDDARRRRCAMSGSRPSRARCHALSSISMSCPKCEPRAQGRRRWWWWGAFVVLLAVAAWLDQSRRAPPESGSRLQAPGSTLRTRASDSRTGLQASDAGLRGRANRVDPEA